MGYKNPPNVRNVIRILQRLRNWLLSAFEAIVQQFHIDIVTEDTLYKEFCSPHDEMSLSHRYEDFVSKRTQPLPEIPPGVSSKLHDNYYYTRDGRRESKPPTKIYDAAQALLGSGQTPAQQQPVRPGFPYNWQTGKLEIDKK